MISSAARVHIFHRYQISYTDTVGVDGTILKRVYMCGKQDAQVQFVTDYKKFYEREFRVDKKSVKNAMERIVIKTYNSDGSEKARFQWKKMELSGMRARLLRTTIYGWYFTVEDTHVKNVEDIAREFIEHNLPFIECIQAKASGDYYKGRR
jgi:hypothetical protein